jgi:predicted RNA binding protein YcfA (HicA-like mRNA interferase family)
VKSNELYKLLLQHGWTPVSQKGSHVKMKHATTGKIMIFPRHGSQEVGKGLERKILKAANIKK